MLGRLPLATIERRMMKISWVVADGYTFDPTINLNQVKDIGPVWGSWRTWRSCGTDNVIAHEFKKSQDLLQRAFQAVCNFYVPKHDYQSLGRPMGVKLYDGEYNSQVDHVEEVIAMHLAAQSSDIVLMLGFNLVVPENITDKLEQHKIKNYHGLVRSAIAANDTVQWVAVDHTNTPDQAYSTLSNFSCDIMDNVLQLLT
jgi:hypothetical protein